MTNLEQLAMEMDDADARRSLARELAKLRKLEAECRRHQRRLPHQVQTALRVEVAEYDIEPPAIGAPGLFSQGERR